MAGEPFLFSPWPDNMSLEDQCAALAVVLTDHYSDRMDRSEGVIEMASRLLLQYAKEKQENQKQENQKQENQFEFYPEEDGSLSLESAVYQALGAASTAWDGVPKGVFKEDFAREIAKALLKRIEMEPVTLGKATTRELLEEVETRMRLIQNSARGRHLAQLCREASVNLDSRILEYSSIRD